MAKKQRMTQYLYFVLDILIVPPGSLRPLRTVRATFTAYGSSTLKAIPAKGNPAVNVSFLFNKFSYLLTLFS